MANICVIRVRGLTSFSGETSDLCNSGGARQWEAFSSKSGDVAIIDGKSCYCKLFSQHNQRVDGRITASQNSVLILMGSTALR